jgi:hypothetical protein
MNWLLLLLLLAVGLFAALLVYESMVLGTNPLKEIWEDVDQFLVELGISDPELPQTPVRPKPKAEPVAEDVRPAEPIANVFPDNPYWALPNRITKIVTAQRKPWTGEEEDAIRFASDSRYTYQRFKAVQDVRRSAWRGSESILFEGLNDKKLWTRMWSAIGLAEIGRELTVDEVDRALGNERSELVANFFERFVPRANEAQLYIMRQAVRLVDDRGREVILRALARHNHLYRDLYLAAATLDPGPRVQRFIGRSRITRMPSLNFDALLAVVTGKAPLPPELQSVLPEPAADSAPSTPPTPANDKVADEVIEAPVMETPDADEPIEIYDVESEKRDNAVKAPAALNDTFDLTGQ